MNKYILQPEVQEFIRAFEGAVSTLAFTGSPFEKISTLELIEQIESLRKAKTKLPRWYEQQNIVYPPKINMEQTSSELTATYKSALLTGQTLADITGGFGIDSFYFAKQFPVVDYFEVNASLSEIATNNFKQLEAFNINCYSEDGLNHVFTKAYDAIYADPSRRHETKGKVFFLKDCEPNIPANLDAILSNCDLFLLKTSPMLDITAGLTELKAVAEIHIVAIHNEVKELLWLLKKDQKKPLQIKTVNITANSKATFDFKWEAKAVVTYSEPRTYLYEPNASIMKSGGMNHIAEAFGVSKLHEHTHLFTATELITFPGRRFHIEKVIPYSKQAMRELANLKKAHVSTRNFPLTVAELRKKWKLKDGGASYLFFVKLNDNSKAVLVCKKI